MTDNTNNPLLDELMRKEIAAFLEAQQDIRSIVEDFLFGCCMDQANLSDHFWQKFHAVFAGYDHAVQKEMEKDGVSKEERVSFNRKFTCLGMALGIILEMACGDKSPEEFKQKFLSIWDKTDKEILEMETKKLKRRREVAEALAKEFAQGASVIAINIDTGEKITLSPEKDKESSSGLH